MAWPGGRGRWHVAGWFSDGPLPALGYFSQATRKSDLPTRATHGPNLTVSHTHATSICIEINNIHSSQALTPSPVMLSLGSSSFKPHTALTTVRWFGLSAHWRRHLCTLPSRPQNDNLPLSHPFYFLFFSPPPDKAKLSIYCSPHSSSSWEHLAWDIWNLISRYLHRLKQFRLQTSEGLLHQTSRQKLLVHFIFLFFFWRMSWEYQFKVCMGFRMLKDTQVLDLQAYRVNAAFLLLGNPKGLLRAPATLKISFFNDLD